MYTSVIGLVAGLWIAAAPATPATEPTWQTDYKAAKAAAAKDQKPMAVVLGRGENGWSQVAQGGTISPATKETLGKSYVCVYVDVATPEGAELAKQFELQGPALVLSDRGGQYQAYKNAGVMNDATLGQMLTTYSAIRSTSMKPAEGAAPAAAPVYYQPYGNCPNCRPRY